MRFGNWMSDYLSRCVWIDGGMCAGVGLTFVVGDIYMEVLIFWLVNFGDWISDYLVFT